MEKTKHEHPRDDGVELENQFILRLPEEPAKMLHQALQSGNLKERISIKMDNDLRYGEVRFDHWLLHAKIVDLPTVIECLKTIDNKSFYKSADICQLMICKEEQDALDTEKESPNKGKKKDPNKVDKKYLWPHGITPPCKNVRKRRFRKTLKKKNVEAPEIEKEVKRLLRIDNDAVKVDYEIISEDADKRSLDHSKEYNDGEEEEYNERIINKHNKRRNDSSSQKDVNVESDDDASVIAPTRGVGEHDIFGEEVSSSDDDHRASSRMRDLEDISRLSADDSRMSDFSNGGGGGTTMGASTSAGNTAGDLNTSKDEVTEFKHSMFETRSPIGKDIDESSKYGGSNSNLAASSLYFGDEQKRNEYDDDDEYYSNEMKQPQLTSDQVNLKLLELKRQHEELKTQQNLKAEEISSIQNKTLKQRMQETLDNLRSQLVDMETEITHYESIN